MAAGAHPLLLLVGLLTLWAGISSAKETKDICRLPKDAGPCLALFSRWYYNWESKKCETFTYGGCKGNANNFKTLEECKRTCQVRLPRASGGECPKPTGAGICVEQCSSNDDCSAGEKCCSNGCGHACMKVNSGAKSG
ncbi:kunitz-type protease inhibitor 4 [Sphaerodactylus townsendi]|uniref:Uncharacterized protein n=1 Tax=Sphaerodactylus townsendi TaxID=933632 RepID=A0ACB8F7D4_9SAUR|nr:kunitz-type protease inhibitor 4 [Sphaerodactylus townsendi]